MPSNIAEGYGRKTTPGYIRFLYIAYGSNCEMETQILLSRDLGYIKTGKLEILKEKVGEVDPPEAEKRLSNRWKKSTRILEPSNP